MSKNGNQDKFIFYNSNNGDTNIEVVVQNDTVWASFNNMADIFDIDNSGISRHLKNIFDTGELDKQSVVAKIATTGSDGKVYKVDHYSLDVIISVGYRVNSYKATKFRVWATSVLKEYLVKGFAMDDDRLKQGKTLFGKDYFDELLERIRDIRASERRFYQKITEIYIQCSFDYDKNSPVTQQFFAHAQNKLEYAVVGMTAAEIVDVRANYELPKMGLTTWKNQKSGGKVLKGDITIAKNYLSEDEISKLNRLVNMFLDFAENLAEKGKKMSMVDWQEKLDGFLKFNEYELLRNFGSISKNAANLKAELQYQKFKPIQEAEYRSDFDKAIEQIKSTGAIPSETRQKLKKVISNFDKKLKQALDFNPKA